MTCTVYSAALWNMINTEINLQCELKKERKSGFDSKFLTIKKRYLTKLISVHYSIIILLYLVHCSFIFGYGWLHSLCCMMAFVEAFTTKQQFMHPRCVVCHDKIWTKTFLTCFTKMIADCWAAIPDQIWMTNVQCKRKINMLSFTDTNFMIFLFDFERFRIDSVVVF